MVRVELWTGGKSNRASYGNTRGREPRVVRVRPSRAISDNYGSIVDLMPGYSYTLWGLRPPHSWHHRLWVRGLIHPSAWKGLSKKSHYRWRRGPRNPRSRYLKNSWRISRRCLWSLQPPPKRLDHPWIELTPRLTFQLLQSFRRRTLSPEAFGLVEPAPKHHVVGVRHCDYARSERYLLPFELIGVTGSVQALVVMPDHRNRPGEGL